MNEFDKQAHAIEEDTYERLSAQVNPETGDASELYEQAFDAGLSFYETMVSLYQATLNLFSAGLFHLIEQQLADLTHDGAMDIAAADTQLANVTRYYQDHLKIDLTQFGSWDVIQEMRLVANATKHGEGGSAEDLRGIRPELSAPGVKIQQRKCSTFSVAVAAWRRWLVRHGGGF